MRQRVESVRMAVAMLLRSSSAAANVAVFIMVTLAVAAVCRGETSVSLQPFEDELKKEMNNEEFYRALRAEVDPLIEKRGDQGMEGFIFLRLCGDTSVQNGHVYAPLTFWFGVKLGFPYGNDVYALIRMEVPVKVEKGRLTLDWDTSTARGSDIRSRGGGFLGAGDRTGQMRETIAVTIRDAFALRIRDKLKTAIAEAIVREMRDRNVPEAAAQAPVVADVSISRDAIYVSVDPTKPATKLASPHSSLLRTPPPLSEGRARGGLPLELNADQKDQAALIVTLFHDHLWFFRAAKGKQGGGHLHERDRGGLERDQADADKPGSHSVTLYLKRGAAIDDFGRFVNRQNWHDRARVVAVRPGPQWNGEQLVLYEHISFNEKKRGRDIRLPVGDHVLTRDQWKFDSKASSLRILP